jgi:hypothetical protein
LNNQVAHCVRRKDHLLRIAHQHCCTIRIIAEALAMNPALRFITSQRFLEFFSLFGLLCSLGVFVLTVLR